MRQYLPKFIEQMIFPFPALNDRDTNKYFTASNKISIYTAPNRLSECDEFVIKNLRNFEKIVFGDLGAASGITTLEFHNKCCALGLKIDSWTIDLVQNLHRFTRQPFHVFFDAQGNPRQYNILGFTLIYPNNRILKFLKLTRFMDWFVKTNVKCIPKVFSILNKEVYLAKINNKTTGFNAIELDITKKNSLNLGFNLIRLAHCFDNLVTDSDSLVQLLQQINSFSKGKGTKLVIVQRENVVSIFTHTGKHFKKTSSMNGGISLEDEISSVRFDT